MNFRGYCGEFGFQAAVSLVWQKRKHPEDVRLTIPGIRSVVHCRADTSDFLVLRQVLGRHEYDVLFDRPPRFIIDGGANVGYASLFFANRYPGARILAVEPDPRNCAVFRKNCGAYESIRLIEGAIWSSDSTVEIVDGHADNDAFRVTQHCGAAELRTIEAFGLDSLIRRSGEESVDILKLDIEGAEYEVFTAPACGWLWKVGTLIVEVHERLRPGATAALERLISRRAHSVSRSGEYVVVRFAG